MAAARVVHAVLPDFPIHLHKPDRATMRRSGLGRLSDAASDDPRRARPLQISAHLRPAIWIGETEAVHAIRRAEMDDAEAVARLFRAVRQACLPYLPDLHTPDEDLGFFRGRVFAECEVWVAQAGAIDGFIAFRSGWVEHLYVRPERQGQGLVQA